MSASSQTITFSPHPIKGILKHLVYDDAAADYVRIDDAQVEPVPVYCEDSECNCSYKCCCLVHNPINEINHVLERYRELCLGDYDHFDKNSPSWYQTFIDFARKQQPLSKDTIVTHVHETVEISNTNNLFLDKFTVEDYRRKYSIYMHCQEDLLDCLPVCARIRPEWLSNGGLIALVVSWLGVLESFVPQLVAFEFNPVFYALKQDKLDFTWDYFYTTAADLYQPFTKYFTFKVEGTEKVSYFEIKDLKGYRVIFDEYLNEEFRENPSLLHNVSDHHQKYQEQYFKMLLFKLDNLRAVYKHYGYNWLTRTDVGETNIFKYDSSNEGNLEHIFLRCCQRELNTALIQMTATNMHCYCEEVRPGGIDSCDCEAKHFSPTGFGDFQRYIGECCVEDTVSAINHACDDGFRFRKVKAILRRPSIDEDEVKPRKCSKNY